LYLERIGRYHQRNIKGLIDWKLNWDLQKEKTWKAWEYQNLIKNSSKLGWRSKRR